MSNYVENNLGKNETVVLKAKKNWLALFGPALWLIIILVACILVQVLFVDKIVENAIKSGNWADLDSADTMQKVFTAVVWVLFGLAGVVPFVLKLINFICCNLVLTNKRVVGKVGVLRIYSLDIPIEKVDHVQIAAGVFGNLFHYANIKVASAAGNLDNDKLGVFPGISNAQAFKDATTQAIEKHAEEARIAQAAEIAKAMGKSGDNN